MAAIKFTGSNWAEYEKSIMSGSSKPAAAKPAADTRPDFRGTSSTMSAKKRPKIKMPSAQEMAAEEEEERELAGFTPSVLSDPKQRQLGGTYYDTMVDYRTKEAFGTSPTWAEEQETEVGGMSYDERQAAAGADMAANAAAAAAAKAKAIEDEQNRARNTPEALKLQYDTRLDSLVTIYESGEFGDLPLVGQSSGNKSRAQVFREIGKILKALSPEEAAAAGIDQNDLENEARRIYTSLEGKLQGVDRKYDYRYHTDSAGGGTPEDLFPDELDQSVDEPEKPEVIGGEDPETWNVNFGGVEFPDYKPGDVTVNVDLGKEAGPPDSEDKIQPERTIFEEQRGVEASRLKQSGAFTDIGEAGGVGSARIQSRAVGTVEDQLRLGNATPGGFALPPNPYRGRLRTGYHPTKAGMGMPQNMAEVGVARVWLAQEKANLIEAGVRYHPEIGWFGGMITTQAIDPNTEKAMTGVGKYGDQQMDPFREADLLTGNNLARAQAIDAIEERIIGIEQADIQFRNAASGKALDEAYRTEEAKLDRAHEIKKSGLAAGDKRRLEEDKHSYEMAQLQEKFEQERHATQLESEFELGKLAIEYEMKDQMQAAALAHQGAEAELDRSLQTQQLQSARDAAMRQHEIEVAELKLQQQQMAFSIFSSLTQSPMAIYFLSENGGLSVFESLLGDKAQSLAGTMQGLVQHMKANPLPNMQEYGRLRPEERTQEDFRIASLTGQQDVGAMMEGESPLDYLGRAGAYTARRPINIRSAATSLEGKDYREYTPRYQTREMRV